MVQADHAHRFVHRPERCLPRQADGMTDRDDVTGHEAQVRGGLLSQHDAGQSSWIHGIRDRRMPDLVLQVQ